MFLIPPQNDPTLIRYVFLVLKKIKLCISPCFISEHNLSVVSIIYEAITCILYVILPLPNILVDLFLHDNL